LVSCVSKKRSGSAAAKVLYCSEWFKKARAYVEAQKGCWLILSAKFGLLDPERMIEPYDVTLIDMDSGARKLWAKRVFGDFQTCCPSPATVTMLAGQRYREYLIPLLKAAQYEVELPLKGKGIGQQLQWLKREIPAVHTIELVDK
jgi:hypothetical protein